LQYNGAVMQLIFFSCLLLKPTLLKKVVAGILTILFSVSLCCKANAAGLTCSQMFEKTDDGLNISWTPYGKKQKLNVPEVLADSYIQFAIQSDSFRNYLIQQTKKGTPGIITDYKQLADATPLYNFEHGPLLPQRSDGSILSPRQLSFPQLMKYILTNYKLAGSDVEHKAQFTKKEKKEYHPLLMALKRQGLISSVKSGDSTSGLIEGALQKIHSTWENLLRFSPDATRDTLLPLPNKYVVAGGRFRESYYWDSLWIMKGLVESGYGSTAKGMLENFVYMVEKYGIIPNGNRFYYLTRTQVPVFMEMVTYLETQKLLDFRANGARPGTLEYRILKTSVDYYETIWKGTERFKSTFGLFSYSDGAGGASSLTKVVIRPEAGLREARHRELHSMRVFAESGWDMTYSRFGKRPQDWLPVDLNFLLASYTSKLSQLFEQIGDFPQSSKYARESQRIYQQVNKYLFDRKTGLYLDYNFANTALSPVTTAASFFSFYAEAYPHTAQSRDVLRNLLKTLKPGTDLAIHTTNRHEEGQWDGQWSWAPLNEIAFQSLIKYNLIKEARDLAFDYSLMTLTSFYKNNQVFFEKYQAGDGSIILPKNTEIYGNEEGFGWTNGTLSVFLRALSEWGALPQLEAELQKRVNSKE
jgi:alpha,alpha-trehalase